MITGFFLYNKKFQISKITALFKSVIFYAILSIILGTVIFLLHGIDFSLLKRILSVSIMPFSSGYWWVTTVYLILYCLTPAINEFVNTLSKRHFIGVLMFIFIFWYILSRTFVYDYCILEGSVVFYLIGAFIGKYYKETKIHSIFYMLISLFSFILIGIFTVYCCPDGSVGLFSTLMNGVVRGILAPLTAISLFLAFKNLKISYNPAINKISKTAFAIYLFHYSIIIRYFMWIYLENSGNNYLKSWWIPSIILYSIMIFAIGFIVDCIKERLFIKFKLVK